MQSFLFKRYSFFHGGALLPTPDQPTSWSDIYDLLQSRFDIHGDAALSNEEMSEIEIFLSKSGIGHKDQGGLKNSILYRVVNVESADLPDSSHLKTKNLISVNRRNLKHSYESWHPQPITPPSSK